MDLMTGKGQCRPIGQTFFFDLHLVFTLLCSITDRLALWIAFELEVLWKSGLHFSIIENMANLGLAYLTNFVTTAGPGLYNDP